MEIVIHGSSKGPDGNGGIFTVRTFAAWLERVQPAYFTAYAGEDAEGAESTDGLVEINEDNLSAAGGEVDGVWDADAVEAAVEALVNG